MPTFSSALVLFSSTKPHAPKHLKDTCSRLAARPVKTVLILNTTVRGAADRATLEELSRPWTPRCGFKRHLEERRLFLQETTSERELQFAAANTTSTSSRYTQASRQHRAVLITTHTQSWRRMAHFPAGTPSANQQRRVTWGKYNQNHHPPLHIHPSILSSIPLSLSPFSAHSPFPLCFLFVSLAPPHSKKGNLNFILFLILFLTIIRTVFVKEYWQHLLDLWSRVYSFHQRTCLRFNRNRCLVTFIWLKVLYKKEKRKTHHTYATFLL